MTEIKKLFDSRYNLYKDCYNHRVTQSFECLVLDIFNEAQGICDWLDAIHNPKVYNTLDDTILHDIRISESDQLSKARDLLARFDSRQHYSFVAEKVINQVTIKEVSAHDICKYSKDL